MDVLPTLTRPNEDWWLFPAQQRLLSHSIISEMPSRKIVWLVLLVLSPDHQLVVSRGVTYNKEKTALGTFTVTARRTANYDLMVTVDCILLSWESTERRTCSVLAEPNMFGVITV